MSLVALRAIRKSHWLQNLEDFDWLDKDDLPADCIADMRTQENALSIYIIENEQAAIERVGAAFVATGNFIAPFDFVLLDLNAIRGMRIKTHIVDGKTPDAIVNSWHQDLVELSIGKLVNLTRLVQIQQPNRISEKQIKEILIHGAVSKWLSLEFFQKPKIKQGDMKEQIDDLLRKRNLSWPSASTS